MTSTHNQLRGAVAGHSTPDASRRPDGRCGPICSVNASRLLHVRFAATVKNVVRVGNVELAGGDRTTWPTLARLISGPRVPADLRRSRFTTTVNIDESSLALVVLIKKRCPSGDISQ